MSHEFTSKRIGVRWSARGFPDLLTRHMMFEGCYQEDVLATLRATLRPGDVLYDVGAHHGLMSVIGSLAVGPTGRVVSFEPNPTAREHLHEHLRLNGCANVTVEPLAVYDRAGSFDFYVQTGNVSWNSSLVRDFADPRGTIAPIKVTTVTLDSYVASAKLVRPRRAGPAVRSPGSGRVELESPGVGCAAWRSRGGEAELGAGTQPPRRRRGRPRLPGDPRVWCSAPTSRR